MTLWLNTIRLETVWTISCLSSFAFLSLLYAVHRMKPSITLMRIVTIILGLSLIICVGSCYVITHFRDRSRAKRVDYNSTTVLPVKANPAM